MQSQFRLMGWAVCSVVVTLLWKTGATWLVSYFALAQKWHLPVRARPSQAMRVNLNNFRL
jgi:hypothetical protein